MTSSLNDLKQRQIRWAKSADLQPDSASYLSNFEANLLRPLSRQSREAFERGSGSELVDAKDRPAKMRALHSSSALAVNVFDSWVDSNMKPLSTVLGLNDEVISISFEEQFPTGLGGIPPNIDVAMKLSTGHVIGIESKFSEWLTPKPTGRESFKPAYFPAGNSLWQSKSLPCSQKLAELVNDGTEKFIHLNVPQLLKHALGMANELHDQFSLFYMYYDWPGPESDVHQSEIQRFVQLLGSELRFKSFSYQEIFQLLDEQSVQDGDYMEYLRDRYF